MSMTPIDYLSIVAFVALVIGVSMYKSRQQKDSAGYFLAGRGATWWLIGFSLIAANISTEQFVGMSGSGAGNVGLAIASYEWIAAVTLVFVAIFFLPRFLSAGIFTIPEYLEYRYNAVARTVMSIFLMVIYVCVTIVAVVYSGGLTIKTIFEWNLIPSIWLIGVLAAVYTTFGGLKAVIWADLIQGSALIIGGAIVLYFGLHAMAPEGAGLVGGWGAFMEQCGDKMHMSLPSSHPELPMTALFFGIWIPNFYYWGLNQYITQRTLASRSLRQGQEGVMFAAFLKLLIPFIIVIPGIMCATLYKTELGDTPDAAYPLLIRHLIPAGLSGFMLAALAGAVMSSLASMLNSASTIFTMDIYKRFLKPKAEEKELVFMGRLTTVIFVVIGCLIAPKLADPAFGGVFHYIQDFQGFISPGILTAFVFGLIIKRTPAAAAIACMIANVPVYGVLHLKPVQTLLVKAMPFLGSLEEADGAMVGNIAFLNQMAITATCLILVMAVVTLVKPLKEPVTMPKNEAFDMKKSPVVAISGTAIILATIALYVVFW